MTITDAKARNIATLRRHADYHRKRAVMWTAEQRPDLAEWHEGEAAELDAEAAKGTP